MVTKRLQTRDHAGRGLLVAHKREDVLLEDPRHAGVLVPRHLARVQLRVAGQHLDQGRAPSDAAVVGEEQLGSVPDLLALRERLGELFKVSARVDPPVQTTIWFDMIEISKKKK